MAPLSKIRDTLPRARGLLYTLFPNTSLQQSSPQHFFTTLQDSSPTIFYSTLLRRVCTTLLLYYLHVSTTLLYNALLRHLPASLYKSLSSPTLLGCNSLLQHFSTTLFSDSLSLSKLASRSGAGAMGHFNERGKHSSHHEIRYPKQHRKSEINTIILRLPQHAATHPNTQSTLTLKKSKSHQLSQHRPQIAKTNFCVINAENSVASARS